ncbi:hypothetical protein OIU34_02680 [Pararhizobium sp. BT-229]|uniref:hypothetical protein n=1 Tax=Pararhizobium sp. BT-229 TaxID=2986923 RepID=UPI0021F74E21|nr:hypothetical protein [Pararhizobium sp. BT-229]MCV9960794.1 hypothetical protein [Pararhizobium sp. BT-229]
MKAIYQPRSGFSDHEIAAEHVTILGFVVGEYEPGYMRSGSKKCTLAIIAFEDGRIRETELSALRYVAPADTREGAPE